MKISTYKNFISKSLQFNEHYSQLINPILCSVFSFSSYKNTTLLQEWHIPNFKAEFKYIKE